MKTKLLGGIACLAMSFVWSQADASSVIYSGNLQASGFTIETFAGTDVTYSGSTSNFSITSSLNPGPTLSGSGASSTVSGFTSVGAQIQFTAEFCLLSGCGTVNSIAGGVTVNASGTSTVSGDSTANAIFQMGTALNNQADLINRSSSASGALPGSFNLSTNLSSLETGTIYYVTMEIIGTSSQVGSWSAMVDPMFVYDLSGYNLILSPGVFNGATTPLPAALPLFAGGLGMIGLIGRRRKRKNTAATAAA